MLAVLYWGSTRRVALESVNVLLAEERCAAQINGFRIWEPLVRVAVYDEFVVVATFALLAGEYRSVVSASKRPTLFGLTDLRFRLENRWVTLSLRPESKVLSVLEARLRVDQGSWS